MSSEIAKRTDLGLAAFDSAEDFLKSVADAGDVKGTATADDVRDAMGNVQPRLYDIKVKHSAGIFELPDGAKVEEVTGVVVAYTRANTFYGVAFDDREEGQKPPCFSDDGETVAQRAEAPVTPAGCAACPKNRDATDRAAREAAFELHRDDACSNYLILAVALPGSDVPYRMRLRSTSFKTWAEYAQTLGTQGRFKAYEVATKIRLEVRKGKGGSDYSVAKFTKVGPLPKELAESFASQTDNYRALLRRETADHRADEDSGVNAGKAVKAAAEDAGL